MKVKLISYSQAVDFQNYGIVDQQEEDITAQDLVAFCARVSNPSNQMNT